MELKNMSLIDNEIGAELNELMRMFFEANAVCDTIANRMDVQFNLPDASNVWHHSIAHAFPSNIFGDSIVEYLNKKQFLVFYGNIPLKNFMYNKLSEYFSEFIEIMGRITDHADKICDLATIKHDNSTIDFVGALMSSNITLFSKQAFILYEAAKELDDGKISKVSFNKQFEELFIVPVVE